MSFWREHMPRGMLLRSGLDWHLDAEDEATLKAFVAKLGLSEAEALPLSRDRYLSYVAWFAREKELAPSVEYIDALIRGRDGGFVAETSSGQIEAQAVVVATGFREHAHVPPDVAALLPDGSYGHTCEYVDFAPFAGRSVVIVGGRQSAFESAALLAEAGAKAVHVVHRHNTPDFTASDWSWVEGLMRRMEEEPGWYGALSEVERIELDTRFWVEGRRKLEPWLASRLAQR
jgi:cation diffusion facilitator CzcD-associated flavoprotein CzcO